MKFATIAVASVALVGSVVSAAPFSYACNYPIHYFGASGIQPDISKAMARWNSKDNRNRVINRGSTVSETGSYVKVSCTPNSDAASDIYQRDCNNALSWLWNTVTASNSQWMDRAGFVPESCWVQAGEHLVKWQQK